MTNLDLITEVNFQLRRNGATCDSFVTCFYNMGRNYPFNFHNRDEMLLVPLDAPVSISFDFGAVYKDYCDHFGRSLFFGAPDDEYRRIYASVMASQAAGIAALHVGNRCAAADAAGARGDRRSRPTAKPSATAWATALAWMCMNLPSL